MSLPAATTPPEAELHAGIVQQVVDALIFADREGLIRVWNAGAQALFGWPAEQALGRSLDLIIPEHLRRAHWEGFNRAIALGRTRHAGQIRTTRGVRRGGGRCYVDMSFAIVRARDGTVLGSVAMARDASAKRALEEALRACRERRAGQA